MDDALAYGLEIQSCKILNKLDESICFSREYNKALEKKINYICILFWFLKKYLKYFILISEKIIVPS